MCSVIEIKNANEYYIHYHSPESLPNAPAKNSKSMEEQHGIFNQNLSLTTICTLIVKQTGALTNNHN